MTDTPNPSETFRTRGWVKALLALSLALNVAIAGLAVGVILRHGGTPQRTDRLLGLGPLTEAMTREDWRAMRPAYLELNPDLRAGAAALRQDFNSLLAALRADPFDEAAVDTALAAITRRNVDRLESGRVLLGGYMRGLPAERRIQIADRLENVLEKGSRSGRSDASRERRSEHERGQRSGN